MTATAKLKVSWPRLLAILEGRGWNRQTLIRDGKISESTLDRIQSGGYSNETTVRRLEAALEVKRTEFLEISANPKVAQPPQPDFTRGPSMTTQAQTYPTEVEAFFRRRGRWDDFTPEQREILKGLAVRFEPFAVPHNHNPDENDLMGFELLAYAGPGKTPADLYRAAKSAGLSAGDLGVALFEVGLCTTRSLVQQAGASIRRQQWQNLVISLNVDQDMLADAPRAGLGDSLATHSAPFILGIEANEDLMVGHVRPMQELLACQGTGWLALDDSNAGNLNAQAALRPRVRMVKVDWKCFQRLYEEELSREHRLCPGLLQWLDDYESTTCLVVEGVETKPMKDTLQRVWKEEGRGRALWMQGHHIRIPPPWDRWLVPLGGDPQQPKAYILPAQVAGDSRPGGDAPESKPLTSLFLAILDKELET